MTILDHGRTIILRLRHGIYWSSGVKITNQDIRFGWKMYSDPITGPARLESCDHIASIRLVGRYEAILTLKVIYALVLLVRLPPVYPHAWSRLRLTPHDATEKLSQDTGLDYQDSGYWTNGPYQVSNFVKDDRIELTPMKHYHVHRGPFLKKMIFDAKPPSTFAGDWNHGGPRNHGAFQVNLWTFGGSPDPDVFRNYFVSKFIDRATNKHSAVDLNDAGIDDPVIDNAMQKGANSFDPKVRARWHKVVQERLNKQAYWVILYYRANVVTSDKHVVGDTPYPTSGVFGNTWNPWGWSFNGG